MDVTTTQLQRGPCLKLIFSFAEIEDANDMEERNFNINNLAEVRFKFNFQKEANIIHSISWKRHESAPTLNHIIQINVTCKQLQFSKQFIGSEKWTPWIKMGVSSKEVSSVEPLKITLIVNKSKNIKFKNLYEETDFCDFHLKAVDSDVMVPVHKACISLHSDVFKRMLQSKQWEENKNDFIEIDIEQVTLQTLENLKKYMYLGILPNDGQLLLSLLLLAKCYMINDLMAECIVRLALNVKPEDLYSLQEFAIDNRIPELVQAIVQITPDETVQIAHEMENNKVCGKTGGKTLGEKNL